MSTEHEKTEYDIPMITFYFMMFGVPPLIIALAFYLSNRIRTR